MKADEQTAVDCLALYAIVAAGRERHSSCEAPLWQLQLMNKRGTQFLGKNAAA